ncbi:putative HTH-type transcriptional regulator [Corynebacterium glaucum]|uniref:TetR/AcrR family transcriptional regulator n=1 Tax=Corynebacterium glaucum TaxID=187491 RepID=UPI0025B2E973|nr:TetR/AcrR family transcriptional regulator [Corynebacterium glaucum]WJZ07003.1 putative HTH-type transcriptional regulator [Corynebacterium glaucum]
MTVDKLGPRALARLRTEERIEQLAFAHLDEGGVEAVNLRAVARDLGISPSALYRYIPDREGLLTTLIAASYTQLAEAVESELGAQAADTAAADCCRVLAAAMRRWALAYPQRWALIYGSPVANFHAPAEATGAAGTRVIALLGELLQDARPSSVAGARSEVFMEDLYAIGQDETPGLELDVVELGLELWAKLIGLISAEVFGHFGEATLRDPEEFFLRSVDRSMRALFGK